MSTQNRITEIRISLIPENDHYGVFVTKEFAPENGGGTQTFIIGAFKHPHIALDAAKGAVTLSPGTATTQMSGWEPVKL